MPHPSLLFDSDGNPVQYRRADGSEVDIDRQALAREGVFLPTHNVGTRDIQEMTVAVRSTVEDIKDSFDPKTGSVLVGMDASHAGYWNKNHRFYTLKGMKRYVDTWLMYDGAPYIRDHEYYTSENRLGTVVDAAVRSTGKETGYEDLTVEITDRDEIDKVVSGKSLAVSVGGTPVDGVECSCCSHDLHGQGFRPRQIHFDKRPKDGWLHASAFGGTMTNEEFWEIEETEDGKWVGRCWHLRGIDAPPEHDRDGSASKIGYFYHGVMKKEVSKVLFGADRNEDTGEWAHIRGLVEAADAIEDEEARLQVVLSAIGKISDGNEGPIDRARFTVIPSRKDLYVADSADDAVRQAKGLDQERAFFDANLWVFASSLSDNFDGRVRAYHGLGGRLVMAAKEDLTGRAPSDADIGRALGLSPRDFGQWFRGEGATLDSETRRLVERLHARRQRSRTRSHTA